MSLNNRENTRSMCEIAIRIRMSFLRLARFEGVNSDR